MLIKGKVIEEVKNTKNKTSKKIRTKLSDLPKEVKDDNLLEEIKTEKNCKENE